MPSPLSCDTNIKNTIFDDFLSAKNGTLHLKKVYVKHKVFSWSRNYILPLLESFVNSFLRIVKIKCALVIITWRVACLLKNKKNCATFFAKTYRSGNAAGDSCKATLWHTQTIRLELLHSCPDTVHGITLHKTLWSTFLTARKPPIHFVEKGIQLCYSGLQIQGAANSPPTRSLIIIQHFRAESNHFCVGFARGLW